MADTTKAQKLAAAKRRAIKVEQIKKKKGTGKKENDTEILSNHDQRNTGTSHLDETLSVSESSVPKQPMTLDDSISVQQLTMEDGEILTSENASPNLFSRGNPSKSEPTNASTGYKSDIVANHQSPKRRDSELDRSLISGKQNESDVKEEDFIRRGDSSICDDTPEILQKDRDDFQENLSQIGNSSLTDTQGKSGHELKKSDGSYIKSPREVDNVGKELSEQDPINSKNGLRIESLERAYEEARNECIELRAKLEAVENQNQSLLKDVERMRRLHPHDFENEGLDVLQNETHDELVKKIHDLENEILELRRDVKDELQENIKSEVSSVLTSPGANFTEVDLGIDFLSHSRATNISRGSLGNFITSGLNVITGASSGPNDDGNSLDELIDFDEEAFRKAKEKETNLRNERIKDIKRSLKRWEGWMLDIVESRVQFDDGFGPIFEI